MGRSTEARVLPAAHGQACSWPARPARASASVPGHPEQRMTTNASVETPRPSLPRSSPPRIHIGGVAIDAVTLEGAIDAIEDLVTARQGGTVFTPNVDHIVQCTEDARLRDADRKS